VRADEEGPRGQMVYIPVGMISRDLDGDGAEELLIVRNTLDTGTSYLSKSPVPKAGGLKALKWRDNGFETLWSQEPIDGCIVGLESADMDGDGREELILAATLDSDSLWTPARTQLHLYKRK